MFPKAIIDAIKKDAMERFPIESCGVIVEGREGLRYVAFENTSTSPTTSFHVDERLLLPIIKSVKAIVHSHPNGPDCPSETDMQQQQAWNIPFGIVTTDGSDCFEPFFWGKGVPKAPLIGRGFRHGVTDCYALVRDYFEDKLGVVLRDYPRNWEWWNEGGDFYERYFVTEGFFKIDESEVRENDCFMACIRSKTPNHGGIYVGNSLILHHLTSRLAVDPSRLSKREPIGAWTKLIAGTWVRHESQR